MNVKLIRIDDKSEVDVPIGEVVLGRGPLLGCTDKRVSRSHCQISLSESGDVILKSTHINPVYYHRKDKPTLEIRNGNSIVLNNGDEFALLPDSYRFRICFCPESKTVNNLNGYGKSEVISKEYEKKDEVEKTEPTLIKQNDLSFGNLENNAKEIKQEVINDSNINFIMKQEGEKEDSVVHRNISGSVTNTPRKLPSWMTDSSQNNVASTSKSPKQRKRKEETKDETVSKKRSKSTAKTVAKNSSERTNNDKADREDGDNEFLKTKDPNKNAEKLHELSDEECDYSAGENEVTGPDKNKETPYEMNNKEGEINARAVSPTSSMEESRTDNIQAANQSTSKSPKQRKRKEETKDETVSKKRSKSTAKTVAKNSSERTNNDKTDREDGDNEFLKTKDPNKNAEKLHELSDEECEYSAGENEVTGPDKNKETPHEMNNKEGEINARAESPTSSMEESRTDNIQVANQSSAVAPSRIPRRQKCQYGASCYRKNPQHRIDFSHPGDMDYDDELPECPFGTACYRKNKLHRLDYDHTHPPHQANTQQPKNKRNNTKKNYADDDDEEDDYDYEDPFLNDASSDDYQPTDSGSNDSAPSEGDEEDDTKRMLKEAKKFTRKKT